MSVLTRLPLPAMIDRPCEDCPRTRTLGVERTVDGREEVTVLAGCEACEGSHTVL